MLRSAASARLKGSTCTGTLTGSTTTTVCAMRSLGFHHPGGIYHNKAKNHFPLIAGGTIMSRFQRGRFDFEGPTSYDNDHRVPVVATDKMEKTGFYQFSEWEKRLNPQLMNSHQSLKITPEFVGSRSGRYNPILGWLKFGGTRKFKIQERNWMKNRGLHYGNYVEGQRALPVVKRVPKLGAHGPNHRHEGKLQYTEVSLSKIIWAIDAGVLNRNETVTLHTLRSLGPAFLPEPDIVWPGVCIVPGDVTELKYPIHLEFQRAHPDVIQLIERAEGTFVATYLSPEGIYQELHPEEFPTFLDQHMPDNHSFNNVHALPSERGFLSQWYDQEGKYAHPEAGRRLSHYVKPPHHRDFPATFEEYERVKHHQKFHFEMPGTGTELPWFSERTAEMERPQEGRLRQ